MKTEDEPPNAG